MIKYGLQLGTVAPKPIKITDTAVFIAENITPYTETIDGKTINGYQYDYTGYTKDEYILLMAEKNAKLEQDIIDTQLALCDLYESFGGE